MSKTSLVRFLSFNSSKHAGQVCITERLIDIDGKEIQLVVEPPQKEEHVIPLSVTVKRICGPIRHLKLERRHEYLKSLVARHAKIRSRRDRARPLLWSTTFGRFDA
jgi:hypothetical protein